MPYLAKAISEGLHLPLDARVQHPLQGEAEVVVQGVDGEVNEPSPGHQVYARVAEVFRGGQVLEVKAKVLQPGSGGRGVKRVDFRRRGEGEVGQLVGFLLGGEPVVGQYLVLGGGKGCQLL